jgi:hypothetical protein
MFKQVGYALGWGMILRLALLRAVKDCHQCRSGPAFLVLYGSGLGWSSVGSLCQSSEVGPGYYCYLRQGPCGV